MARKNNGIDHEIDPEVIRKRTDLFNEYVKPYFNMIYKLTIKYSSNRGDVEENYTEVLTNFYRRIETYNPERSILTWLHIVTKRFVFALDAKRRREDNKDRDTDIELYAYDCLDDRKPSSNVLNVDNYREYYNDDILDVLDMMKPIHRNALLLQEAGYSLKEIAQIEHDRGNLDSSNIETVKSRLFLARRFLQKNLTRDGERIPNQECY